MAIRLNFFAENAFEIGCLLENQFLCAGAMA